jgi:hypothetical protein
MSKYIELAKKLKALADQGVGGEKTNAEEQLKKLLRKHRISLSELEVNFSEWRKFKLKRGFKSNDLFFQVAASVFNTSNFTYRGHGGSISLNCTPEQMIEIECKYNFYYTAFKTDASLFYRAFVQRNHIVPSNSTKLIGEMSEKEQEEALRMLKMAKSLDVHSFHKQLEQTPEKL